MPPAPPGPRRCSTTQPRQPWQSSTLCSKRGTRPPHGRAEFAKLCRRAPAPPLLFIANSPDEDALPPPQVADTGIDYPVYRTAEALGTSSEFLQYLEATKFSLTLGYPRTRLTTNCDIVTETAWRFSDVLTV
jgi:hypothetical protein